MPNQRSVLDRVFNALGNEARRDIVTRLVRSPASVGELARPLDMSLPSVMQHLQVLEDCGLVRTSKLGRVRTCEIVPDGLRLAESWLGGRRTSWESRLDQLGALLDQPDPTPDPRSPHQRTAR